MNLSALKSLLFTEPRHSLRTISLSVILSLCLFPEAPLHAAADAGAIVLAQTPPAVQKTVQENIGAGKITAISKDEENGVPAFDVDFTKDGRNRTLQVSEDGRLLSIEIAIAEAPAPIQKTVATQLASQKLISVDKTFEADEITYVVSYTAKDGHESQFTIGAGGALLEAEIMLAEAPAPVQATLTGQMGTGQLTTLTKIIDDKVTYEAEFTKDGKNAAVVIGNEGTLLRVEITLEETGAAKNTILAKVGNGKILTVWKSFEKREKVLPFKVESIKDGKPFNFSVGPKGRFLGMDE